MKIEGGTSTNLKITLRKGNLITEASYNEKGKIKVKQILKEENDKDNIFGIIIGSTIMLEVVNIMLIINNFSKHYLLAGITILFLILLFNILDILKDKRIRKNHSAEHMVINAVNNKNRKVSIEEIKQEKVLDKNCSTNIFPTYCMLNLIFVIISIAFNVPVSFILVLIMFKFCYNKKPFAYLGYLFQIFYFKKPDNVSLELAKAAADLLIELQKE